MSGPVHHKEILLHSNQSRKNKPSLYIPLVFNKNEPFLCRKASRPRISRETRKTCASLTGSPGKSDRGLCVECRRDLESQGSRVLKTEACPSRGAAHPCPSDENQGKFIRSLTIDWIGPNSLLVFCVSPVEVALKFSRKPGFNSRDQQEAVRRFFFLLQHLS